MGDKNSLTKLEPAPAAHRAIGFSLPPAAATGGRQGGPGGSLTLSAPVLLMVLIVAGNHQVSEVAVLPQPALGSRAPAYHFLSG